MAVGDLTVTLVGSFNTLELAIVAWTAGNDAVPATDSHQLFIKDGIGSNRFQLVKIAKAAS